MGIITMKIKRHKWVDVCGFDQLLIFHKWPHWGAPQIFLLIILWWKFQVLYNDKSNCLVRHLSLYRSNYGSISFGSTDSKRPVLRGVCGCLSIYLEKKKINKMVANSYWIFSKKEKKTHIGFKFGEGV